MDTASPWACQGYGSGQQCVGTLPSVSFKPLNDPGQTQLSCQLTRVGFEFGSPKYQPSFLPGLCPQGPRRDYDVAGSL
mgnify:CR=1 FL=1